MITTSDTITVNKMIRLGVLTNYETTNVSLFVKHDGTEKRFTATSVTNATETSTGLIVFQNIQLWGNGSYSLYVTAENNYDLDVSGTSLEKLATGYIKKISNESTLNI